MSLSMQITVYPHRMAIFRNGWSTIEVDNALNVIEFYGNEFESTNDSIESIDNH